MHMATHCNNPFVKVTLTASPHHNQTRYTKAIESYGKFLSVCEKMGDPGEAHKFMRSRT